MTVSEQTVLSMLSVARDLGLDSLVQYCEKHILTSMNGDNACEFLSAALQLEKDHPGQYFS